MLGYPSGASELHAVAQLVLVNCSVIAHLVICCIHTRFLLFNYHIWC